LPSRQPRAGGNRLSVGAHIWRHGEKDDAARRDLVKEVVHHLFDPADPIEGDHAMVFRRECPDILLGSLTNDLGAGDGRSASSISSESRNAASVGNETFDDNCRSRVMNSSRVGAGIGRE
jgi:hypothetical protein